MPEAEIKINFTEVTKAQAEVKKLREELAKISQARGGAGGMAKTPLAETSKAAQDLGTKGVAGIDAANNRLRRLADTGRIAEMQARKLVGTLLAVASPIAIASMFVSRANEQRQQGIEARATRGEAAAEGALGPGNKLDDATRKRLYTKYVQGGWVKPADFDKLMGKYGTTPSRAEGALRTAALGGEGVMSEKRLGRAEEQRSKKFQEDDAFREYVIQTRAKAFKESYDMAEEMAKSSDPARAKEGRDVMRQIRETTDQLNQLKKDKPGQYTPLPVREVTPSNAGGRP